MLEIALATLEKTGVSHSRTAAEADDQALVDRRRLIDAEE
jgi:hypothetical protein